MTNKDPFPLDLNTVDENVLVKQLKISARLAKRILALRPYQSIDQLYQVWGIDPQTLQRILPLVRVGPLKEITPAVPVEKAAEPLLPETSFVIDDSSSKPVITAQSSTSQDLISPEKPASSDTSVPMARPWKIDFILLLILLAGAYFRFTGLNWDENAHQHPDERFITMVAEQIRGVDGIGAYFDTANSTLNPLKFGSYTYGMFPLFITRLVAEWVKMTEYDSIVLVGRAMSGLFDLAAVWMLYLLGKRLYNKRTGMLAAALGAAAVLPIQLSHYFAVDSFSTVFVVASIYFAVLAIPINRPEEKITRFNLLYFALFGLMVGLAGACKVNTLPVLGAIVLAGLAQLIAAWKKPHFVDLLKIILPGWILAGGMAFVAFRVFQPYAFSGTGFLGFGLNQRWIDVIKEVTDSVAGLSDWPPNTHWTNRPITYAWSNMVLWGLGLPLGLAGWLGWALAGWRMWKGEWRSHLLPFAWVAVYFIWQNIQFWRYMRYFLPVYPFIILFAAWFLLEIYDRTQQSRVKLLENGTHFSLQMASFRRVWQGAAGLLALGLVLIGAYAYAFAFTQIYTRPITRITASRWIMENIPGPLNVIVETPQGNRSYPVQIINRQVVEPGNAGTSVIRVVKNGSVSTITTVDVSQVGVSIYFRLTRDEQGEDIITEGRLALSDVNQDQKQTISFGDVNIAQDQTVYLHYQIRNAIQFSLADISLRNENPDDPSLPVDLSIQNQAPGELKGSLVIKSGSVIRVNRLEINQFQQVFIPTETSLKVSVFNDGDDQNPLVVSTQKMNFPQAGMKLQPVFNFSPIQLNGGKTYQIRYEIAGGGPILLKGASYTMETSWDDALPLSIDQYDPLGGIYMPGNLELYEPDTPAKREAMIKTLSESDYIIIPSNRAYDAMPRLPLRYPMTLKYYQALFDCNCNGDALENRAYALEPPFKSPLGFDLMTTFESSPNLGPLVISDQSADESFTVYDHPKVFIFKKSADFSIEKVTTLLNSVDLDQVIVQTPMVYSQMPTAMQLLPDRLAAQTEGGTWSAMFDRYALLNANEMMGGLVWYLLLLFLGWMVFPLGFVVFPGLPDRGYPMLRMLALILITWLAWISGSFKWLTFSQLSIGSSIGLILILSATLAYRVRQALYEYIRRHWKYILTTECVFLAVFLFSLNVRIGNPDLWHPWLGGEKPMDFAFFNAVLKAVYFPPENPWFSGHYINYYYYGYVIAAIPTKLLGIIPSIAYNLILPSWFAMTGIGVFSVGYNLVAALWKNPAGTNLDPVIPAPALFSKHLKTIKITPYLPYLAGVFALMAVLFLGNLYVVREFWHYLPEVVVPGGKVDSPVSQVGAVFAGAVQVLSGQEKLPGENGRWYFESSRPILHDGPDTPIAEFPYFTFLYADMHPHLLTMPFYALAMAWMLSLFLFPISKMKWPERILSLVLAGLVLGSFRASHTWDFPTFTSIAMMTVFWSNWRSTTGSIRHRIQLIIIYELLLVGLAVLFYWPFSQWFQTEYVSLEFWKGARTPLVDYLFVFALSLFMLVSLLIQGLFSDLKAGVQRWVNSLKQGAYDRRYLKYDFTVLVGLIVMGVCWNFNYQVLTLGLPILVGVGMLVFFKPGLPILRRITLILFGIGFAITMLVEVVVLKGDTGRSNMVFRFYNQAWFILGVAAAVALIDLLFALPHWTRRVKMLWLSVLVLLVIGAASYPLIATGKKMTDRWPNIQNPPHTLDGAAFMRGDANDPSGQTPAIYNDENRKLNLSLDYDAIQYMQDHIVGSPVIVEGHTEEYRWGSRYSIYTGLPSVVGWSWHVRQHNSLLDGAIIEKRINEVNDFYNTQDLSTAEAFLNRYRVKYIVVADLERAYYSPEGINKFKDMVDQGKLKIVYGDNTPQLATIFEVADVK